MDKPHVINIIMVGYHPWQIFADQGFRTRMGHLIETMSRTHQVGKLMYVYPAEQSAPTRGGQPVLADRGWEVYQPFPRVWAVNFRPGFPSEQEAPVLVGQLARKLGFSSPVLWLSTPLATHYIDRVGENLVVFDAVDNWLEHVQFRGFKEQIAKGYQTIREKAHIIFTVSPGLAKAFQGCRGKVHWLPNGVDVDFFQQCAAQPLPPDVKGLRRPLLGYVGVMEDRLDVALLGYLANHMPKATLVMVGPVHGSIRKALERHPNIRCLGFRHYREIPRYVNGFNVCLIPHLVSALTESMDPLKLYEYLALGKPVVSTWVAGARRMAGLIYLARTPKEFYASILEALKEPSYKKSNRMQAARSWGWQQRVNQILACLAGEEIGQLPEHTGEKPRHNLCGVI